MRLKLSALALSLAALGASHAVAGTIPYPNVGTPNPVTYTFTATATGDLKAYFAEYTGASYTEEVGLLVNGVNTGIYGLDNHTSVPGDSVDFGNVTKGDTLVFLDDVFSTGTTWYSDPSMNGGQNHIYSTSAAANQLYAGSPVGTYVAFEDLPYSTSDFNYHDDTFVFTNTTLTSSVPEPATWGLMLMGVAILGATLRMRPRAALA